MGIAASVDYRDVQQLSYLLHSDEENDENAAIAPIDFTPTSSPEQLPDLLQKNNTVSGQDNLSDQDNQEDKNKENQPNEAITKSEQPLPNVGDLEIFALQ